MPNDLFKTTQLKRVFKYVKREGKKESVVELDDIPGLSPQDIIKVYSAQHPELVNGVVSTPEYKGDDVIFTITVIIGTKG